MLGTMNEIRDMTIVISFCLIQESSAPSCSDLSTTLITAYADNANKMTTRKFAVIRLAITFQFLACSFSFSKASTNASLNPIVIDAT